jgi:hypothetical protein
MSANRRRESLVDWAQRAVSVRVVVFALVAGMAAAAMPISLEFDEGDVSLYPNSAFARDKGGKGGKGGKGNNGGNGSGNLKNEKNKSGSAVPDTTDGGQSPPFIVADEGVVVAQFTTNISKRKPDNEVSLVSDPHQAVSFFTQLNGMQGHSVTHRWIHAGVVEYQASFKINGPSWRVWSTQLLPADKPGDWQVEVVDETNKVLRTGHLDYRPTG